MTLYLHGWLYAEATKDIKSDYGNINFYYCLVLLQVSDLGIDYDGPVHHTDIEVTGVQLDDIDNVLSTEERESLTTTLLDMEREASDEEVWLAQYRVAQSFIHSRSQL